MDKKPTAPPASPDRARVAIAGAVRPAAMFAAAAAMALVAPMTRSAPAGGDPDERRQPQAGGRGERSLSVTPDSYDATARTVEVVLSAGTGVRRYYFTEELEIAAEAIDLARVEGGVCPLLDTHNQYQLDGVIGRVLSARIEGGQLLGTVAFADTPAGRAIEARVASGELRAISIGYRVTAWQRVAIDENDHETWRATRWELLEASLVPVPADPNAVVRSAPGNSQPHGSQEEDDMRRNLASGVAAAALTTAAAPTAPAGTTGTEQRQEPAAPTPPAQQQRQEPTAPATVEASAVVTAARNAGLDADAREALLIRHATTPFTRDALMADIGARFAERDSSATTVNRVPAAAGDNTSMSRAMSDAVLHRLSPGSQLPDASRGFRGMGLLRMAEELLGSSGISTRGMTPHEIAERALHTTSDFPALMSNAMGRRLRSVYEEHQPTYRLWARRAPNAPNFKAIDVVQLSAMPELLKVNEAGEFKYGTFSDGKVSYGITTYGRIISLSRQLIINDDLNALDRVLTGFAGSAARLENRTVYSRIVDNPVMPDGKTLFHADHGNVGNAAAISQTSLGAGRARMRKQKGLADEQLNLTPAHLIVPTDLEQVAYQFTSAQFMPARAADTNEFRAGGRTAVDPIVEPLLDASSASAFYLAASNSQIDTVEYAYLEGAEGVQLSTRMGFTVDGVDMKASLDFAAATIDHRGLDKTG